MNSIELPEVKKLISIQDGNNIWQFYKKETKIEEYHIVSNNPFVISSNGINYLLTSDSNFFIPEEYQYVLLTSKKPTRKNLTNDALKFKRWLKHPDFLEISPEEVTLSWLNGFHFIKEDESNNLKGLRQPQLGALYSILAHIQNPDDRGIIVMPTGTGKTETMLATLIANQCGKLLVTVPSDSLRSQIANKFITLGLLKDYKIVDDKCMNPIVGVITNRFSTIENLRNFIAKLNVAVTTMDMLTGWTNDEKSVLTDNFSHLFVDEAHHSEARSWGELINRFDKEKVFLFTATPYRNDGKSLQGKFLFNFSLRRAQEQRYYKKINYLPIREYNREKADKKIAEKAVSVLRENIANGYNHILMARCVSKNRAKEVYEYYKQHSDLSPILIYTGIPGLSHRIESIKRKEHSIIVCVNMLGEGFDLSELKIAAIHDERQSLPITLQFIGRFTRTSYNELGNASFITNTAYPPIGKELDELYAKDADWNLILPRLNENATQKEIDLKNFLDGFRNLDSSKIPFQSIRPAMSTVVYKNSTDTWIPNNWKNGIEDIDTYDYQFSTNNQNTLVIILGKINKVDWGDFETVQNLEWHMIVVYWDLRPNINRVFINSSIKGLKSKALIKNIFSENVCKIDGMNVFRIFHNVKRLSLYNVGARKGIGRDITFQSYFGRDVQDGIKLLEQGTLIKNNIFGIGHKEGEKLSLGCSVKGKIWSYMRGNLSELTSWCKDIGETLEDDTIDPNTVLKNTLKIEKIARRPNVMPIATDWHPDMYMYPDNRYVIFVNGNRYDLSDSELSIEERDISESLQFSFNTSDCKIIFELELGEQTIDGQKTFFHKIHKVTNIDVKISYGNHVQNLEDFFQEYTPTIWFADESQLYQNNYVELREEIDQIPLNNIITDNWVGVSIDKESQDISPYIQDSIQYYFINKILNNFEIIYDDDGKGEIADIIGINNIENHIDVHLYHLKYAIDGKISNNINNFYQVCGQAQKSLNWKNKKGKEFFDRLFKRKIKPLNDQSCSRIIKGTEEQLEELLNAAKWTKEMKFHIYIVQPGLSKSNASNDILRLLGVTHHYLHTVGNVELIVYSSN
jgi:superfamily II DNA or RNA helicase